MDLEEFNSTAADRLRPALAACCDVPRWVDAILAKRPYGDRAALTAVADQLLRELDDNEVDRVTAAAVAAGATCVKEPGRTYYGAWQSVLLDPEGNAFRLNHLELDSHP